MGACRPLHLSSPMLARLQSFVLQGIEARPCEVEIDADDTGIDAKAVIVGLPDAAVRESIERVKSALFNAGYVPPKGRILINLAPAELKKEGPLYDLPIALGILQAMGVLAGHRAGPAPSNPQTRLPAPSSPAASGIDLRRYLIAGELSLDGRVRPIKGAIAMAMLARQREGAGGAGVILPADNAAEAAVVPNLEVIGVSTLAELVGVILGRLEPPLASPVDVHARLTSPPASIDFADVKGQEGVKRALTIAAAGAHNLLMLGPSARHGQDRAADSGIALLSAATPAHLERTDRLHLCALQNPHEQRWHQFVEQRSAEPDDAAGCPERCSPAELASPHSPPARRLTTGQAAMTR